MNKTDIKKLVSQNQLEKAVDNLRHWALKNGKDEFDDNLVLISYRLHRVKERERSGIVSFSESLREQSSIAKLILDFLSQVKEADLEEKNKDDEKTAKYYLLIEANFKPDDKYKIEQVTKKLVAITDDYSIKVQRVVRGSIKIFIISSEKAFEKLISLFIKRELSERIGYAVKDLRRNEIVEDNNSKLDKGRKVILFLASNPTETAKLQLEKEFVRVSSSLQEHENDYKLVAEWAITPNALQKAILHHKPSIIHFSGHGEKSTNYKEGGIILQTPYGKSKKVNGNALANLFRIMTKRSKIEVVLLNACYSEEQANSIKQYVPFVIGMTDTIGDSSAIEFSTGFYRGLATENDVEFAFELAKNMIELEGLPDDKIPILTKRN